MLVFGMKDVDYVVINDNIVVRMKWDGNDVKLCIEAPRDVTIERDKVYERRCREEGIAVTRRYNKLIKDKKKSVPRSPLPTPGE